MPLPAHPHRPPACPGGGGHGRPHAGDSSLVWARRPALHSPEVAEVIEHGLFVKRVFGDVDNDRAVHKVTHPVGAPF